jgi:hypothetical protein
MAPRYQVQLKDTAGVQVALFDHFKELTFTHRVNSPGTITLQLDGNDERVDLFGPDSIVEVLRSDLAIGLDWYTEAAGFHRVPDDNINENGVADFISTSVGFLDLIRRRGIAWYKGTPQAEKAGTGEAVIKEYVRENAGSGASTGAGRRGYGITQGLTVQSNKDEGLAWQGDRAFRLLLEVIQEVGLATGIYFDVVSTGPATFEFRTYYGQRREDRRLYNLVGGLNPAGNPPVVFSVARGSLGDIKHLVDRTVEANAVFVLGEGEGENRLVWEEIDADAIEVSPWNRVEVFRDASNEGSDTDRLRSLGQAVLEEMKYEEALTTRKVLQLENMAYGLHYHWGDRVTLRHRGNDYHKQIIGVNGRVDDTGEHLEFEFGELS